MGEAEADMLHSNYMDVYKMRVLQPACSLRCNWYKVQHNKYAEQAGDG